MNSERAISENISDQIKAELEKKGIEVYGNTNFWVEMGIEDCMLE